MFQEILPHVREDWTFREFVVIVSHSLSHVGRKLLCRFRFLEIRISIYDLFRLTIIQK